MKTIFLCGTSLFLLMFFCAASAQPTPSLPRIGYISSSGSPRTTSATYDAFLLGLRDSGYIEGSNVAIDVRYAEGRLDLMPALVNDLVQQKVDVIFAANNVVIRAARQATKTIPIVMISSLDPIAAGYAESFARPGGNTTGLAWLSRDLSAKRVELLKEMLPKVSIVSVLWDIDAPGPAVAYKEYAAAAKSFRLELRSVGIRGPKPDLQEAFQKSGHADAMIVVGNPLVSQYANELVSLATKRRMPTMAEGQRYVEIGALVSYGASLVHLHRRAAEYVADILRGAKPAELPIKFATKFEIFVNLKTAKQIGVTIPQHVLVQADKVIK